MKILVISSNLIGDNILSTGVIKYLSYNNPNAKFTFVMGPSATPLFKNFQYVEKIITITKKRYNLHWLQILRICIGKEWDIIIDFRSSLISYFLNYKKKYIFKKNTINNHIQQLTDYFGFDCSDLYIQTSKEEDDIVEKNISKNFNYFVIFPGGNWKPKIWDTQNYNFLIKKISLKNPDIKFIIVGSKEEEKLYLDKIIKNIESQKIINLFGKSLTLTAAYMKKSKLLIGNDSGLTHLASATKLRSIVLFGPTNDKVYGPFDTNSNTVRTKESYEYFKSLKIDKNKSYMNSISVEEVYDIVKIRGYCA